MEAAAPSTRRDLPRGTGERQGQVKLASVAIAAGYRVHWRRNDTADSTESRDVTVTEALLQQVPVDDHFVGVSALAANGVESR